MAGIIQRITLLLDEAARRKTEQGIAESLKKGTDADAPTRNLGKIEGALGKLKSFAVSVGAALAAAFALNKLIDFAGASIRAAAESERAWSSLGTTLKNIGFDIRDVQKDVDALAKKLQATTRFDDEAAVQAFNNILQITGDYEKSLGAVAVAADLATAKQIGLEEAATLVGRAAVGNTTQLERMGIEIAKGADAVEVLRERFKGAAEEEGKTFSGRLQQMRNDFGNLQEALGQVLIDMGGGMSVIDNLGALFRSLTEWVQENTSTLRNWGNWVVDTFKIAGESANVLGRWLDLVAAKWNVLAVDLTDPGAFRAAREEVRRLQDELDAALGDRGGAIRARGNRLAGAANRLNDPLAEQAEIAAERDRLRRIGDASARNRGRLGAGGAAGTERTPSIGEIHPFDPANIRARPVETNIERMFRENPGLGRRAVNFDPAAELERLKRENPLPSAEETPFPDMAASVEEDFTSIADSIGEHSAEIAETMAETFGGVFEKLIQDGFTLGNVLSQVGKGLGQTILREIAAMAKGKAKENLAWAIESTAMGLKALARSDPRAGGYFLSAGKHLAAAAAWGLAGAAGAAAGGAGGRDSFGGAGRESGREEADEAGRKRMVPEIHIHVDGFEGNSPRHQERLVEGVRNIFDRYGVAVVINGSGPT